MDEQDEVRLRDMLDAARKGSRFIAGKSRNALDEDDMLTYALIRAIEVIGEAASRVTAETRNARPTIEWKNIIGMRNKMIHDYIEIDLNILWMTATVRLPELIAQLEAVLPPE